MNEYTYTPSFLVFPSLRKSGSQELRLHNQRCCSLATFPIRKELPAGVDRWSLAHGVFYVEDGWYLCAQPSRICLICYCWFAGIGVWICVVGEMEDDLGVWREGLMDWGWNRQLAKLLSGNEVRGKVAIAALQMIVNFSRSLSRWPRKLFWSTVFSGFGKVLTLGDLFPELLRAQGAFFFGEEGRSFWQETTVHGLQLPGKPWSSRLSCFSVQ